MISMADGYDPSKMENAMRALSTKVLNQGDATRKKVYPVNMVDDEPEEVNYTHEEEQDEETFLAMLLEEGDENAMVIQDFEDNIVQVCQGSPELSMAFTAYQEARAKLKDKARIRGFWPLRQSSKGKGKFKKGKGFGKQRQTLADRIAASHCRICGAKGHWKQECPNRDRASTAADANLTITEENFFTSELIDHLPENTEDTMWQACQTGSPPCMGLPPVHHHVNDEFIFTTSHILHDQHVSKGQNPKVLSKLEFRKLFKKACEASFSVVRSLKTDGERVQDLGDKGSGIIDTGASKTVIGEKRVHDLLATLSTDHQKLVRWHKSETVFRFGNNGTLKSLGAVFVPFGRRWLKVEVVQGWTPFLISNAFLSALDAELQISKCILKIPKWGVSVKLQRNCKGLFTVALKELIEAANEFEGRPCSEEVITMACNDQLNQSREVYCSQQQQQRNAAAATVAQPQSHRSQLSPDRVHHTCTHGVAEGDVPEGGRNSLCSRSGPKLEPPLGSDGGSQAELQPGAYHEGSPTTWSSESSRMGRDEVSRGQVERTSVHGSLCLGPQVCNVHGLESKAGLRLGSQLSPVCSAEDAGRDSVQGEETAARKGDDASGHVSGDGIRSWTPSRLGSDLRDHHILGRDKQSEQPWQSEKKCLRGGGEDRNGDRIGCPNQGGEDAASSAASARNGHAQEGDERPVSGSLKISPNWKSTTALTHDLCLQIEGAQLSIEKELARLKSIWHGDRHPSLKSPWKLDLLEIYCEEDSQITGHAQRLGLKARRFTAKDGDLATSSGREALWKIIMEEKPREIWVAPDCKYWGNYSRRNMGRSQSTADKILDGRNQQRVHLKLCQQIYWHQMEMGGQFHLEQPQGSEAIYQPELKDVYEGTLCTTFDMCEVGKLLAPWSKYKLRGNNFLRKRTNVFTSSKIFHQAFDSRLCPGNHQHTQIAGKVYHLGRWISLSEYAARYSSGFGKNVARYLSCRFGHPPLIHDELLIGDVSPAFVQAVVARKREAINQDAPAEPDPDAKRQKYGHKQPPRGPFGCAHGEFWNGVFDQINSKIPRVGKRVFTEGDEVAVVQKGVPGFKVRRIEVCRGTEQLRVPESGVERSEIPFRVTVVKDRSTGQAEVLGPAEEWVKLPKYQQTRKGKPAKVSLTIFGGPLENSETGEDKNGSREDRNLEGLGEEVIGDDMEPTPGKGIPRGIAQHGPGFLSLSGEEKAQLRRLHHNLGHPSPEKFVRFLKERHADPNIVQGALDFQCDSCTESKRGFEASRPAVIHEDLGFHQVVGMDTAVWTNGVGQQFSFTHIIDEGTLFHLGAPVNNTDAETQVKTFGHTWLRWAGPPQTVYVDPATEYKSGLWQDTMQSLDVHIKMTVGAAHWQLGRAEIHGSIVKKMLDKMDAEKPIRTAEEFEQSLIQAFNAKNSLSRIKGYSPEQAVLGISRRLPGSLTSDASVGSLSMAEDEGPASDQFRVALERRCLARKAFIDADNSSSLRRALLRRSRPLRGPYEVGDLVLYWHRRGANLKRERGRWFGPASVVAVEGTRNVWLNHSGRLVRACPEQIRPASFREWQQSSVQSPAQGKSPASVFSKNLKGGGFIDLEGEGIPEDEVVSEGYDPSILEQSVGEPDGEQSAGSPPQSETPEEAEKQLSPREIPVPESDSEAMEPFEIPIPNGDFSGDDGSEEDGLLCDGGGDLVFGDDVEFEGFSCDVWEMEIPLETKQEVPVLCASSADESVLLVSDTKKRKVEVKLSSLKSPNQFRMAVAKHKEIGAWLKHSTVRRAAKGKIPESAIMRCRWILSWKGASPTDNPADVAHGQKAKARLVVVGFEDPGVGVVKNDSPTLSKDGRQMVVQQVSSHGWELISFDISTAFLHGDGDGRLLGIHPPPELAEALEMREGETCQLVGGACGRVDAPYLWFCKFRDTLIQEGFRQCPMDPCVFTLVSKDSSGKDRIHGSLGIHVDDGIGGGDAKFVETLGRIRKKFSFGSFERDHSRSLASGSVNGMIRVWSMIKLITLKRLLHWKFPRLVGFREQVQSLLKRPVNSGALLEPCNTQPSTLGRICRQR